MTEENDASDAEDNVGSKPGRRGFAGMSRFATSCRRKKWSFFTISANQRITMRAYSRIGKAFTRCGVSSGP